MENLDFANSALLFLFYSVAGWGIEVLYRLIRYRKLTNPGLLFGPWLPIFGVGGLLATYAFIPIATQPVLVFLAGLLIGGATEWLVHLIEEKFLKIKTVRYPFFQHLFKDRVHLVNLLLYGLTSLLFVYVLEDRVQQVIELFRHTSIRYISSLGLGLLLVDALISLGSVFQLLKAYEAGLIKEQVPETETRAKIYQWYQRLKDGDFQVLKYRHLRRTYSQLQLDMDTTRADKKAKPVVQSKSFAAGLNFYKLFWVFVIACVLGFIIESIWCFLRYGRIESRQGMLYGPFSQVYGIAAVAMTVVLSRLEKKGKIWVFIGSSLLGGITEIILSFVQEKLFGSVSWHYSKALGGICNGRTSLVYMLFWGILGLIFIRVIYPKMSDLIEAIPNQRGIVLTWLLCLFLIFDAGISCLAVYRWNERIQGVETTQAFWQEIDRLYPDQYMKEIYPNMQNRK